MQKSKVYQEAFQNAITLGYNKGKQDYKQKKPYKAVIENIIIPSSVIDKLALLLVSDMVIIVVFMIIMMIIITKSKN